LRIHRALLQWRHLAPILQRMRNVFTNILPTYMSAPTQTHRCTWVCARAHTHTLHILDITVQEYCWGSALCCICVCTYTYVCVYIYIYSYDFYQLFTAHIFNHPDYSCDGPIMRVAIQIFSKVNSRLILYSKLSSEVTFEMWLSRYARGRTSHTHSHTRTHTHTHTHIHIRAHPHLRTTAPAHAGRSRLSTIPGLFCTITTLK